MHLIRKITSDFLIFSKSSLGNQQIRKAIGFKRAHNSSAINKSNSECNMRFVQYYRNENLEQINVGLISENGESLTELKPKSNMVNFIEKVGVNAEELKKLYDVMESEPISKNITLLAPLTNPEKIIAVGLNYKDHCEEQNKPLPREPIFFSKFASAITGPKGNVIAHSVTNKLDWECELAVIIGKKAHKISPDQVNEYIFGYTIAQDISARDWQKERNGGQFLLGKSMDTFCPLGPCIVHKSLIKDPQNLSLTCKINGIVKQSGNTKNMIFSIEEIISRLSGFFTLKPGDIILTGTPGGVGAHRNPPEFLKPGDVIESEIENIGKIVNTVISE